MSSDTETVGGSGFIFDLFVESEYRRRGVAERAMKLLEVEARRMKIGRLSLHVFGSNSPARTLYTKLGYKETDINMAKEIE
jgi:ribosomal protein S18 acetylase RimI-like enzyme